MYSPKSGLVDDLVKTLVFLCPFTNVLGIFIANKFLSYVQIWAGVCTIFILLYFADNYKKMSIVKIWWFVWLAILGLFMIGLIMGPWQALTWKKGLIQWLGMLNMIIIGGYICHRLSENDGFLFQIFNMIKLTVFILAVVGVLQFFYFNLVSDNNLFNFSYLNILANGHVWNPATSENNYRSNAYVREPAHYGLFLEMGLGISLIRIGMVDRKLKEAIKPYVSLFWSYIVLMGIFVSISLLAYLGLIIILFSLWLLFMPLKVFFKRGLYCLLILFLVLIVAAKFVPDYMVISKLQSLLILFPASTSNTLDFSFNSGSLSALAIAANLFVALHVVMHYPLLGTGLGSSLQAYLHYRPDYISQNINEIFMLNADGSSALFIRLMAETGLLGLFIYIGIVIYFIYKAKLALDNYRKNSGVNALSTIAYAICGSAVGIILTYFIRMGTYYDPEYWIFMALLAAIPFILHLRSENK